MTTVADFGIAGVYVCARALAPGNGTPFALMSFTVNSRLLSNFKQEGVKSCLPRQPFEPTLLVS
jgi:hypothetical protein